MKHSSSHPKIVVVIPTYNEAENIGRMLDVLIQEEFPLIKNVVMEILVVDSESPDGTGKIVTEKMKKHKQVQLLSTRKEGLGADYVKGMRYAMDKLKADAVVEFDADFQHDPKDIKQLVAAYLSGADYVIGSRYVPGGAIPSEWGINRKIMSIFGSLFARIVLFHFKLHDLTSGLKLTSSKYLSQVDLEHLYSKYYAYKIHILHEVLKLGAKTVEVPIIFHERKEGTSKISKKDLIDSFLLVLRLRIRDSQKILKFGTVGLIGAVVNFVLLRVFRWYGLPEVAAWALSTEVAIISNFTLNNLWTFRENIILGFGNILKKFIQFNITSSGALLIQSIAGPIGVMLIGKQYDFIVFVVVVAFLVLPYNYLMYNLVIWRKKK